MARRHIATILAVAMMALPSLPARAADPAQCQYEAREWAASVWHMDSRLKVPLWAGLATLIAGPRAGVYAAVLAANAESPRERWMIRRYETWCLGGYEGEPPRPGPLFLELF